MSVPRVRPRRARLRVASLAGMSMWLAACSTAPEAPTANMAPGDGPCVTAPSNATTGSTSAKGANAAAPTPRIALQGQLSLKLGALGDQPAQGLSLGFFFSGNAQVGQLDLMTLMGSQMAQVNWQADEAWLLNDNGRQRFNSIEALSEAALGEALPLRALIAWMQGQPDPELPSQPEPLAGSTSGAGGFTQAGWAIDTSQLAQKKLTAQRPGDATHRSAMIKVYLDR
jgi:outer membrane biogenesis lipoprotein LolB